MRFSEIVTEAVEEITSDSGKKVMVLRNPTKLQMTKAMAGWRGSARCLLDTSTGTLYMCNKWDMYHYQMIKQLGLSDEHCIGFTGFPDAVGMYFPSKSSTKAMQKRFMEHLNKQIAVLRSSKSMTRLWGPEFPIKEVEPD